MALQLNPDKTTWIAIIIALISLLGTVYTESSRNDHANSTRIAALEAHQTDSGSRLDRIETKLDVLIQGMISSTVARPVVAVAPPAR